MGVLEAVIVLSVIIVVPGLAAMVSYLKGHNGAGLAGLVYAVFMFLVGLMSIGSGDHPAAGYAIGGLTIILVLLLGWAPIAGALLRARPDSWWSERFYSSARRVRAVKERPEASEPTGKGEK